MYFSVSLTYTLLSCTKLLFLTRILSLYSYPLYVFLCLSLLSCAKLLFSNGIFFIIVIPFLCISLSLSLNYFLVPSCSFRLAYFQYIHNLSMYFSISLTYSLSTFLKCFFFSHFICDYCYHFAKYCITERNL